MSPARRAASVISGAFEQVTGAPLLPRHPALRRGTEWQILSNNAVRFLRQCAPFFTGPTAQTINFPAGIIKRGCPPTSYLRAMTQITPAGAMIEFSAPDTER